MEGNFRHRPSSQERQLSQQSLEEYLLRLDQKMREIEQAKMDADSFIQSRHVRLICRNSKGDEVYGPA